VQDTGHVELGNMSKHHKRNPYRKIYEEYHGNIPDGHHIHHIDGNPNNNDITNLIAVTPEEHAAIHPHEFVKWASIGGKLGGQKSKEEKLGFCGWDSEKWSQVNKNRKYSEASKRKKSKTLKNLYATGEMIHWSKLYDKDVVSEKIKQGDPGKSMRGKTAWNKGINMELKNPEQARLNKSAAALNRQKFACENCGRSFDKGNLTKHSKKCVIKI
jgi:hypothetical protein